MDPDPRDAPTLPDESGGSIDRPTKVGQFEIVGPLGEGGMGLVFEARDTLLGRRVALKLLHPSRGGGNASARLVREAQALAQLSHPHVVKVYAVGSVAGAPYIAMELVEGVTLREWLHAPRDPRAVVELLRGVGDGLAAVHRLGLVHRDVKPSNVLVDGRGVAKLGDFGLVGVADTPASGEAGTIPRAIAAEDLTITDGVLGTPAYMAPEQAAGGAVDARADQYSFAKMLGEALGDPPPPRLRPVLARAMSADAARRYPSMEPLLAALGSNRRAARRWWIAGGAVAAIAIAVAVVLAWRSGRTPAAAPATPCPSPDDRVAAVWGAPRRAALQARLASIDPAEGATRFATAAGVFDGAARRWSDLHVASCRATRVERAQSDVALDRRIACLDRAMVELDETIRLVEAATDPASLDAAMPAVVGLPPPAACSDDEALASAVAPPLDAAARAEYDAIVRAVTAIDVTMRRRGLPEGIEAQARGVVERARALAHPTVLAEALWRLAVIQMNSDASAGAVASLDEAIRVGAAARNDRLVARLWTRSIEYQLEDGKPPEELALMLPAASAAVLRAGDPAELRFDLLFTESAIEQSRGELGKARALLDQAVALIETMRGDGDAPELDERLRDAQLRTAGLHLGAGEWAAAATAFRTFIAMANTQLGPDHPEAMQGSFNVGFCLTMLEDLEGALAAYQEAARIGEAKLGPSPRLATLVEAVGAALVRLGRHADALPHVERAVAIARSTLPAGDLGLARPLGTLSATLSGLARYDDARPLVAEELAIYEAVNQPNEDWAIALLRLGELEVKSRHCRAARPPLERALGMYRAAGLAESPVAAEITALLERCR